MSNARHNPGNNDHSVEITPSPHRIKVLFGGEVIADSQHTQVLLETNHAPVYYFPISDVTMEFLQPTDKKTHCPYKGDARYWSVKVADKVAEDAVWNYPEPITDCPDIKQLVAFYWDKMDAWLADDQPVSAPPKKQN